MPLSELEGFRRVASTRRAPPIPFETDDERIESS